MSSPKYSVIVPVYNRPGEVEELLASLCLQTYTNFEVVLVEDGSSVTSQSVYEKYSSKLSIQYFFKPNSGPGPSRNFGFSKAKGDYLVVFDSDCVIPPDYFMLVERHLAANPLDVWGGPDRGHGDFTVLQQAMAYSMSSVLTTGGIRGGKKSIGSFQPRSFNMGMSRNAYEKTGGFKFDRYAEDIELSIRASKMGLKVGLIAPAFVYHKRRATLQQFFNQVSNFGKGRVHVGRAHEGAIKLTHFFPAFFLLGLLFIPIVAIVSPVLGLALLTGYIVYLVAVLFDAWRTVKDLRVAILAVPSVLVQMTGYGSGFLKALFSKQ
ncbi:MAG TPA: glycosyltransferase [Cyclobacteriaceae bacterium]|nr:glycosyltransferase [Cyclobacteriaceae bacterium]